jgi:Ni/Co efflux regulator RcnB
MRKFLVAAALGALLAAPALAQDRDHRGGNGGGNGGEHGGQAPHAAPTPAPAPAPGAGATARGQALQQMEHAQPRPTFNRGSGNRVNGNPGNGGSMSGPRPGGSVSGPPNNNFRPNNGGPGNGRPNNQGFNGPRPGPRPDFRAYNRNFTATHRFRGPAYHRPSGFVYRRWVFGDYLPSIYWGSDYWLYDFSDFDLPPPPPGTVWVRYGDDALLIDRYSGEIIEVEYNVFYCSPP